MTFRVSDLPLPETPDKWGRQGLVSHPKDNLEQSRVDEIAKP